MGDTIFRTAGTSPRLWGDSVNAVRDIIKDRYIPTLVGRFPTHCANLVELPVHPHACGEIYEILESDNPLTGTSPRLWGDYTRGGLVRAFTRYIPTLVGRFLSEWRCGCNASVHPHACGEIETEKAPPFL